LIVDFYKTKQERQQEKDKSEEKEEVKTYNNLDVQSLLEQVMKQSQAPLMNPFMRPPFPGPPRPPFRRPSQIVRGPAGSHMMGPPRAGFMGGPGPMRPPQMGMPMPGPGPIPVQMNQAPRVPIQPPKPATVD